MQYGTNLKFCMTNTMRVAVVLIHGSRRVKQLAIGLISQAHVLNQRPIMLRMWLMHWTPWIRKESSANHETNRHWQRLRFNISNLILLLRIKFCVSFLENANVSFVLVVCQIYFLFLYICVLCLKQYIGGILYSCMPKNPIYTERLPCIKFLNARFKFF